MATIPAGSRNTKFERGCLAVLLPRLFYMEQKSQLKFLRTNYKTTREINSLSFHLNSAHLNSQGKLVKVRVWIGEQHVITVRKAATTA